MPNLNEDLVVLEIAVTRDTLEEIKAAIAQHLWEPNDGLRLILGAGLGALAARRITEGEPHEDAILRLSRRLAEVEGRLAGTRHDLAQARESLRQWELASGATRQLVASVEQVIRRQNQEIAELKSRLQAQEAELASWRAQAAAEPAQVALPPGRNADQATENGRLRGLFKKRVTGHG